MKYFFITNVNKLSPLLDFNIGTINVDLHNDFEFVKSSIVNESLELYFKKIGKNNSVSEENAVIIFFNLIETNIQLIQKKYINNFLTLTNFARGELTSANKYYEDEKVRYFFIDFVDTPMINIFCKEAVIFLW